MWVAVRKLLSSDASARGGRRNLKTRQCSAILNSRRFAELIVFGVIPHVHEHHVKIDSSR